MASLTATLQQHADEVSCCAFSPSLLATSSADKTVRVYSAADLSELPYSPLGGHGYGVHCCRFSSCGSHLASCSSDGTVVVRSAATGETTAVLLHPGRSPLRACALAPDSSLLLAGASDGTVALWELASGTLRRCSPVSEASVVACCFSPCGQMFVSGCTRGDLKLWDVDVNPLSSRKDAHDLGVTCCCFAPQFHVVEGCVEFRLASCGQDSLLKIWMVSQREGAAPTMKLLHSLTSQSAPVLSCAFSSDGELVVSGSVDKSVAIYDAKAGTLLDTLKQHDRYVTAVALSPTAPWMATGSMDRTVKVWTLTGRAGGTEADDAAPATYRGSGLPGGAGMLRPVADWSEEDVQRWLCQEGLQDLAAIFRTNNMDGAELLLLDKDIAGELGIESVGLRGRLLRKVQALRAKESDSDVPDEFLCPITRELMDDPVIAADGYSYERASIESWFRGKSKTSPMTNLPLQTTLLTPNRSLKTAISRWKSSQ